MPARLVQVTLLNNSDYPIVWQDDGRPHGFWQEPWYPSNIKRLLKGQRASWRQESGGVMTGVEGWAAFKVDVPLAANVGDRAEYFNLWWERPYLGYFKRDITQPQQPPRHPGPTLTYLHDLGFVNTGTDTNPLEILPMGAFVPLTVPAYLLNDLNATHVEWFVEVLNTGTSSRLALQAAPQGIIYALMPNNDLLWYKHDGRADGTFKWAFPEGRKVGTGWNAKQLFSGGDNIIYALMPNNDLLWYKHDGRNDGTFNWAFPEGRKVGTGWNVKQLLYGGDGIIYALMPNGDLLWYRHDGRADGAFKWAYNEGRKVGTGWNVKQLFYGGNGVIYALMPNGDLLWYRHDGRSEGTFTWAFPEGRKVGTGWNVKQVFSDGDGIIYALMPNNDLLWYKHDGYADGTFRWAFPEGRKVGTGWNVKQLFAG